MKLLRILVISIIVELVITLFDLLFQFYDIFYLKKFLSESEISNIEDFMYEMNNQVLFWLNLFYIFLFIVFVTWFYKSYKQLYLIHANKLSFKPLLAIFGYIVPIVQFFIPYKMMSELWEHTYNRKENYIYQNNLIKIWWALFVSRLIYSRLIATKYSHAEYADDLLIYTYHLVVLDIIWLAYLFIFKKIVKQVSISKS